MEEWVNRVQSAFLKFHEGVDGSGAVFRSTIIGQWSLLRGESITFQSRSDSNSGEHKVRSMQVDDKYPILVGAPLFKRQSPELSMKERTIVPRASLEEDPQKV